MEQKKQIEEMAKELCGMDRECKDCNMDSICISQNCASIFYKLGYRKQSEGEWKLKPRFYDFEVDTYVCSCCNFSVRDDEVKKMNYCPNCGAKMKDGE